MTFSEKFKEIIKELKSINPNDDFKHEELLDKEINIVTEDMNETINYLKTNCTAEEYVWLSEIFIDIVEKSPSREFIDELYNLAKKYPEETKEYNIMSFIKEADNYISDY